MLCLFALSMVLSAWALPPDEKKVTLDLKDVPMETFLNTVKQKAGINMLYNSQMFKGVEPVTVKATNEPWKELLDRVLSPKGFTYATKDGIVVIKKKDQKTRTLEGKVVDEQGGELPGVTVLILGKERNIGTMTDADGAFSLGLPEGDVTIRLSFVGMQTLEIHTGKLNLDKVHTFKLKPDSKQLEEVVVTGYVKISKNSFTGTSVTVTADQLMSVSKTNVLGALQTFDPSFRIAENNLAGSNPNNVPELYIRGRSGIGTTQLDAQSLSKTSLKNNPNLPTFIMDGFEISVQKLYDMDPSRIESITILKDAAATALYGARAMNGVVVVTTRRGAEGRPVFRYSGNFTVQLRPTYADYDIMNSGDQMSVYAELERKGFLNSDLVNASNSGVYGKMYKMINSFDPETGKFQLENTREARNAFLRHYANANTDWFKILFRNSLQQEHSISISGGSQRSRSYASLSFLNDEGWTVADKVRRYTANLRNDYKLAENLDLGVQLIGSLRDQKAPGSLSRRSNTVEGSYDRDFDINPFSYALNTSRVLTCFDEAGNPEFFTRNYAPFNIINELQNNSIHLKMVDVKAQLELGWEIIKGLRYEFMGAVRYVKSDREHMITENSNMAEAYRADYTSTIRAKNKFLYKDPEHPEAEAISVLPYGGFYNRSEDQLTSYDVRNSFKYNKKFGLHDLNMIAGVQVKYADRQKFSNTGYGYQYNEGGKVTVDYRIMKMMIESNFDYYGMGTTRDRFAAFYFNADYGFDSRYIFSGTVRYDGTNALGSNRSARWLPTWNVSAKWNISNEHFMESTEWIDQLSLRGSYGLTASMNSSASASAKFVNENTKRPYGNEIESVITLEALENSELTWEKGHVLNLGIDIGLFNRRLDVIFDYWRRNSFDLIASLKNSAIGGTLYKYANYADMESRGYDLAIGITPIRTKNWNWKSNLTLGYTTTKITNSKNMPSIYNMINASGGNREGYPVGSLFSIQYKGLEHDTGVPLFINESGVIANSVYFQSTNLDYLKYEGPIDPEYTGGWSNTFRWKDLSLNVFLTFQAGNKIRLAPAFKTSYSELDAMSSVFFDRWMQPGDEKYTNVPSIVDVLTADGFKSKYPYNSYNYSTERVAKGDFIRLKTISLTYKVPKHYLQRTKVLSDVSLTVAGSNLWLIYADKKLNGQDPEFYNTGGVAQPLSRQFTIALNIGF